MLDRAGAKEDDSMATTGSDGRMPATYITHGGGPCFFMDWDPPDAWDELRAALEAIVPGLPRRPPAIVVVTAHWESPEVAIASGARPGLVYDYGGFPPHTYELTYPAPGDPDLAARIAGLLEEAGIAHRLDPTHGWDHGVFVPLKVMVPDADIPVVAMSLRADLDADAHLELGRALAPLRDEDVLIVGSGSSFHHFAHFGSPEAAPFDEWLNDTVVEPAERRWASLADWESAPYARHAHGREEHLLPLMVVAGSASDRPARVAFRGEVLSTPMSCWLFD
jgi:aromatic ring-opening dioxygenase catalytic subunit (LigB family)